jgi:hypothetical protein
MNRDVATQHLILGAPETAALTLDQQVGDQIPACDQVAGVDPAGHSS